MKKFSVDWRLLSGFIALLFFIVVIGGLGIFQIKNLSETVAVLGKDYLPMQRAILEMKNNNGLYAMGVRNYVFWKSSRYLEAVSAVENLEVINEYSREFDRNLNNYLKHTTTTEQETWARNILVSQTEIRSLGEKIINLSNELGKETSASKKTKIKKEIDSYMMVFENTLYKINDFIDRTIERNAVDSIKTQIDFSDSIRNQAISFLGGSLVFVLLIGMQTVFIVYRDRKRDRERREQLVRKMIKMEEEEKRNLSLQIHDQMGQDLSGLKIYLDLIKNDIETDSTDGNEKLKKNIQEGKKILTNIMKKTHNISELLSPPELEEVGLSDSVDALILQYKEITDIHFTYKKPEKDIKISKEYTLFFYRVVQEGLTNIIKHSGARNVEIKFYEDGNFHNLMLADDGKGFRYKGFLKRRAKLGGQLGLLGLEERAELLGGNFIIKTSLRKGTTLLVQLPVRKGM